MTATPVGFAAFPQTDHVAESLGMEVLDDTPGRAVLQMRVRQDMLNGFAITHGGIVFALADGCFALTCNQDIGKELMVAQHCEIDYLSPTMEGDLLVARGNLVHRGRRAGVYDVTVSAVTDDGERTIAIFRGRCRALPQRG
ncbi:hotdog fold thioesterase [Luteococcus sp. H138]|uniref:hotdog fold thioesterase n=1 Tax=unclassified Luteococcus TaxID=2639923 RepID=UPI00313C74F6